jgi:hypothetical protein
MGLHIIGYFAQEVIFRFFIKLKVTKKTDVSSIKISVATSENRLHFLYDPFFIFNLYIVTILIQSNFWV